MVIILLFISCIAKYERSSYEEDVVTEELMYRILLVTLAS